MRSNRGALRMPGELHASLGESNISRCQTGWTLKARDTRFLSLSTCYWDNFGKGTSDRFLRRRRSISNRVTSWSTLPHTRFGRFGGHLWHGEYRHSGGFLHLVGLASMRHPRSVSRCLFCLFLCSFGRLFYQCLELFGTLAIVACDAMFACPCFHFQTEPPGRMWHGPRQDRFGQAGPVLDERCCHCVNQPVLQDSNATNATSGPPPPARQRCIQVDLKWNPFQQILQGGHKGDAFFFVFHVIAGKMNISPPTSKLPTRITKTEQGIGTCQHVQYLCAIA